MRARRRIAKEWGDGWSEFNGIKRIENGNAREISVCFQERSDRKFNISKVEYVMNRSAFLDALTCTF